MNLTPCEQTGLVKPRLRWLIWLTFTIVWTVALVAPVSKEPWDIGEYQIDLKVIVAKCLHVAVYAIFAALSGWLRAGARIRYLLMFFVMAHGTATELLQLFVSTRSGLLTDVGLDNLGVGLGLWLSWKWWSAPDTKQQSAGADGAEPWRG